MILLFPFFPPLNPRTQSEALLTRKLTSPLFGKTVPTPMDSFGEIFQAMVHDHGKRPRNFGPLEHSSHSAAGVNPLTGDRLEIQFQIDETGLIKAVAFTGKASALATTSASIMTGVLPEKSKIEALGKISETLDWFSGERPIPDDLPEDEFSVLLEIRKFPHRIRCASLPWKTAAIALRND